MWDFKVPLVAPLWQSVLSPLQGLLLRPAATVIGSGFASWY
jgi:hypothetical protein